MIDPQAELRADLKDVIQQSTNETHGMSRRLARLTEVKFNIEERRFAAALEGILEIMCRELTDGDYSPDDLTRFLNAKDNEGKTIRDLFKTIPEQ